MAKMIRGCLFPLLLLLAVVGASVVSLLWPRPSKKQVEAMVRRQLPAGTDATQVVRFLSDHGWDPSGYEKVFQSTLTDPDDIAHGADGLVEVRLDNIGPGGWPFFGYLYMEFAFDRQRKLTRYRVTQFGPEPL